MGLLFQDLDPPCDVCGLDPCYCCCPDCPVCEGVATPECYKNGHIKSKLKSPYYIITASCDFESCERGNFQVERKHVEKTSAGGQKYTIQYVKCPDCGTWAQISKIFCVGG